MKNIFRYKSLWCIGLVLSLFIQSCDLDYQNTGTINPDNVWKDKNMISAFLTDIYGFPGWPANGASSDEGIDANGGNLSDYLRGIIDVEKTGQGFDYGKIDKINFFLQQLETVPESVLSSTEKSQLAGQALFWRAWDYWGKVATFGGVPLITKFQDVTNRESLFVPRNKTSECMAQILKDLDDAISFLPDKWDGVNYGRIDKGIAMAFKGKVQMWYASPLFNPSGDKARWEAAYTTNKAAVDFLKSVGKGLFPDYKQIWKKEQNEEVIMVNPFYYSDHTYNTNLFRPEPISKDAANCNQPILPLLLAYPKKDGSALVLDIERLSDPVYNADFLTDFYTNRDDRFYATIFCGGQIYPTPDFTGGQRYWCTWIWEEDKYTSMGFKQMNRGANYGISGFFSLKAIDESLAMSNVGDGDVDWVEIRFAEVLMNYGECANEVGKAEEALQVLYDIRKRAGIEPGSGRYGVTAASQGDIREAYINERFVEFAFEGKRWGDLRRWKRFDILNNLQHRAGLYTVLNPEEDVTTFDWTNDISNPEVRKKFHAVYRENLDGEPSYKYNLSLNHWFYPIKKNDLDRNSKLEQNNEWGGAFDPLQ